MKYNYINILIEASNKINNTKKVIFLNDNKLRHFYLFNDVSRKYTCLYCNKFYSEKKNLKQHIESKHLGIKYNCKLCDFSTGRKYYLKNHIRRKHITKNN